MKKLLVLFAITLFGSLGITSSYAQLQLSLAIQIAPPELPYYAQPICPGDGYMWIPGYWAYSDNGYDEGYYWVPGVWVFPPNPGYYWTPSYWSFSNGYYGWHSGYWGEYVGFYGGIDYGYGYSGVGFEGGRWHGNTFQYNTAVMNINTTIVHNTYVDRRVMHTSVNRSSYNGPGGYSARPNVHEQIAMRNQHLDPTPEQSSHQFNASKEHNQFANNNHGRPQTVSMNSVKGTRYTQKGVQYRHPSPGQGSQELNRRPENHFAAPKRETQQHANPPARPVQPATAPPGVRPQGHPAQQTQKQEKPSQHNNDKKHN